MSEPIQTTKRCRTCKHWMPLFTGETWGVRSFADAPETERSSILQCLEEFRLREGYEGVWEAVGDTGITDSADRSAAGLKDWPMWGECALTDLDTESPTLARAIDGSQYKAILRCHADFGCIQWDNAENGC